MAVWGGDTKDFYGEREGDPFLSLGERKRGHFCVLVGHVKCTKIGRIICFGSF